MGAVELLQQHAEQKAKGLLSGMDRLKVQMLKDILTSPITKSGMKKDAAAGLAQWEARAQEKGWPSLAAWLAAR